MGIERYTMYTDGGCHNTGDRKGDGSYAFLFLTDNTEYVDVCCEYVEDTTNNRMEMAAVIEGIKHAIEYIKCPKLEIVSDSGYLVKGWTDPAYLDRWVTNGWKTSTNKPVQNIDMWMALQKLSWHIGFIFTHIRGHNKDKNKTHAFWNDICDRACTYMINEVHMPGFFVTLRYYFKTKEFKVIEIQVVEHKEE
jgi:ribonuclease HI